MIKLNSKKVGEYKNINRFRRFQCDTNTPGCTNVCFNRFNPISPIRFWAVQVLFVSAPSIVFSLWIGHAVAQKKPESEAKKLTRKTKVAIISRLICQLTMEVLFAALQFYLYHWKFDEQ
jgi:hypothetical protein